MIFSFSVPDNPKYQAIIDWYMSVDRQERSRAFREIFLSYLTKSHHIMDSQATNPISLPQIQRIRVEEIVEPEIDFDTKFNMIGKRG